jgi:hypothetical protein
LSRYSVQNTREIVTPLFMRLVLISFRHVSVLTSDK